MIYVATKTINNSELILYAEKDKNLICYDTKTNNKLQK